MCSPFFSMPFLAVSHRRLSSVEVGRAGGRVWLEMATGAASTRRKRTNTARGFTGSRPCSDDDRLQSEQLRKILRVDCVDFSGIADAFNQFIGRDKSVANAGNGPSRDMG